MPFYNKSLNFHKPKIQILYQSKITHFTTQKNPLNNEYQRPNRKK
jgi:hypothetical protein